MSRLTKLMRRGLSLLVVFFVFAGLFLSCTQDLGLKDMEGTNPVVGIPEGMGQLSVSIDPLSAPLRKLLDTGFSELSTEFPASRAYMLAQQFTVTLYASDGSIVEERLVNNLDTSWNGITDVASFIVESGTYSLAVDIFNLSMSSEIPVLHGNSSAFEVVAEATSDVTVTCFPILPQELSNNPIYCDLDPWCQNVDTNEVTYGHEAWFVFEAVEMETIIQVSLDSPSYNTFMPFDKNGKNICVDLEMGIGFFQTNESLDYSFSLPTTVGETYYIGAFSIEAIGSIQVPSYPFSIALMSILHDGISVEGSFVIENTPASIKGVQVDGESATLDIALRSGVTGSWNGTSFSGSSVTVDESGTLTLSDGTLTQEIAVSLIPATAMSLGSEWTTVSASSSADSCCAVPVTAGIPLLVEWNSGYDGDGSYSGDCYLSAYDMETGTSYFTSDYYGYGSDAREVTPAADGYLLLKVISFYSSLQTIGLRVYEKVNSSPIMTSGTSFSLVQTMSSSTTSRNISYSDPDGDSISASISCTAAPSDEVMASLISSSIFDSSYGYGEVNVQRNLPTGVYTLTLVLDDGQDFDGTDGVNAPSRVEIPITMTITNTVPVLSLSADVSVCAISTEVSLSFSVPLDPDLDIGSLAFSIQSKPEGAAATISDASFTVGSSSITGTATITPDVAGEWVIAVTGTEASGTVSGIVTIEVYEETQGGIEFDVY